MGLCGNFAHSCAEGSTVEVSNAYRILQPLERSLHSMLQHYLAMNQCYERIILIDSGNSLIPFIRSDGSLPWHCLRSHSIKFLEDLAVIWRRLHHVMRGYKVKSSQIYPRRWGRRRSILSLRLLDQQVTASKANLQVAEPKKFHLQPNIWLKSEVWA